MRRQSRGGAAGFIRWSAVICRSALSGSGDSSWRHRVTDAVPDLILQRNQRRRRQRRRRRRSLDAIDDETGDIDFPIGVIGIAAAVVAEQGWAYSRNLEQGVDHSCLAQIPDQQVALAIDVGPDMMGHLPGVAAQAYAAVIGRRAKPDRTAVGSILKG